MKALHFHAVAANPRVAPALMFQAGNVLRPFRRFLEQSIFAARERQVRYQLPWQSVRSPVGLTLTARDTRIRLRREPPRWLFTDWPEAQPLDLTQPLMVVSRSVNVRVLSAERTAEGLSVEPESPLLPDDNVFWGGRACTVQPGDASGPPRAIATIDGRLLVLRTPFRADDGAWSATVESSFDGAELLADGRRVAVAVLPALDGVTRVFDAADRAFELRDGVLNVDELPAEGPLRADNGVRFAWRSQGNGRSRGRCVQLLAPPSAVGADDTVDPRAAFCDDDVKEVWTQARHSVDTTIKVHRVDRERYQLTLDRLPPPDTLLYLPLDLRNLRLQRRALTQLADAPLPHHVPLLRLCEEPAKARWPAAASRWPSRWYSLGDESRSGTDEQRRFVAKALGSPDFALLEGPPGSGKTTAICELIQQLVADGQRVLLCASTHAAIDNVLERLLGRPGAIDAVRIGRAERVDDAVLGSQFDRRVEALVAAWRGARTFSTAGDGDLREMAERTVMMAANLTCGTTMGILGHPLFRDREGARDDQPVATAPHWDVLIIDEASKTLTQEFLVPALLARRHVIVGDVRQLPPFSDRADVVANLRSLVDPRGRELFARDHQRAMLVLFRLRREALRAAGLRWLVVESPGVVDWIARELAAMESPPFTTARVVSRVGPSPRHLVEVTTGEVLAGATNGLHLAAAAVVLVSTDLLPAVAARLPGDLAPACELAAGKAGLAESDPWHFRHAAWAGDERLLRRSYRERRDEIATEAEAERHEQRWLSGHDLANELAWRITRLHELRRSGNRAERERLQRDLARLKPAAADVDGAIAEIQDIGLPSVLEVLQEGIGAERAGRRGALTEGLAGNGAVFDARFERLSYQHRMHPEISAFARENFYDGKALRDANTIALRDADLGWDYGAFGRRRVWVDVDGREQNGVNADEVRAMRGVLEDFVRWAKDRPPPARSSSPPRWEVACLSFYAKQEGAIAEMLGALTGDARKTRFQWQGVEIVCGTVDRFQGREADLVLLSLRNTHRVGFLDSPNRLNVAVTRARQQLVVLGRARYFEGCGTPELEALANRTERQDGRRWTGGR